MRKILALFLFCTSSIIVEAQINLDSLIYCDKPKLVEYNPYPPKVYPDIYIQIDTFNKKIDTAEIKLIDPNWIKRVVILKEEKYKELFVNNKPVLMIIPKKKFKKNISNLFLNK